MELSVYMNLHQLYMAYMAVHGAIDFMGSSSFFFGGIINKFPVYWHPALSGVGVAIIQFALLYFLYRKKCFLKI